MSPRLLSPTKLLPNAKGFTIIEAILSLAIVGILAGLAFPLYQGYQTSHDFNLSVQHVTSQLRRAQILAINNQNNSAWGIKITNTQTILFAGQNYSTRMTNLDETQSLPANFFTTGLTEIVFAQNTGIPYTHGGMQLSLQNLTATLNINSKGFVE